MTKNNQITFIPLFAKLLDNNNNSITKYGIRSVQNRYIIIKQSAGKRDYYTADYIPDDTRTNYSLADFTGKLIIKNIETNQLSLYQYKKSHFQKPEKAQKEKLDSYRQCTPYYTCTWAGWCGNEIVIVYNTGYGFMCTEPEYSGPCNGSQEFDIHFNLNNVSTYQDCIEIPDGSDPGTPGSGSGSGGSEWIEGTLVTFSITEKIQNIREYLKCINKSVGSVLTVYVDQPNANTDDTYSITRSGVSVEANVGHTFISITQGSVTRVLGFYPTQSINPATNPSSTSLLNNDSGHEFDVSFSAPLSASQTEAVLNAAFSYPQTYNLNSYNCTDFGLQIANAAGYNLTSRIGSWPGGSGHNPGTFGQDVRRSSFPSNVTKNTSRGRAPNNSGNCN